MAIRYRLAALLVLMVGLVVGCGQAEPTAAPSSPSGTQDSSASTPSPTPVNSDTTTPIGESADSASGSSAQNDDPSEIEGWYGVEGHQLYLHCLGTGSPMVIMESGFNDTSETWLLFRLR